MTKGDGQHTRVIGDDNKSLKSEAVVSRTIGKVFQCICAVIKVVGCEEIYLIISRKIDACKTYDGFLYLRRRECLYFSSCFKTLFACVFLGYRILGCYNRNFDKQDVT